MAYKVGTIIVIDDSGNIDWARIANKPVIGAGNVASVTVVNGTPSAGAAVAGTAGTSVFANCYVASLSGGGSAGAVTITANRRSFNCNCACRC